MPTTLGRNLQMCFTKIKRPPPSPDHNPPFPLLKNYNSLYNSNHSSPSSESEPDFATVVASQRFFFSSPGSSNSIIESSELLPKCPSVKDSVAVPTYSPDPYVDFRESMLEMVDARDFIDVKSKWDYLHELLLCYLSLNPKTTHKFIIGAFADVLVTLLSTSDEIDSVPGNCNHKKCT